jgi:hypothetical protein
VLTRVISGGQTGVDLAALDAAAAAGVATGGSMPAGFLTEDGPRPGYAARYGVSELPTADYPSRTRRNVADADATLILLHGPGEPTGGTALTVKAARASGKPYLVERIEDGAAARVAAWLAEVGPAVLNVAGPRESKSPGVYAAARSLLTALFNRSGAAASRR